LLGATIGGAGQRWVGEAMRHSDRKRVASKAGKAGLALPALSVALLASPGCDCGGKLQAIPTCAVGSVSGRACAPDTRTGVSGADVAVGDSDCNGFAYEAHETTAPDGRFTVLDVPIGTHKLVVVAGNFRRDYVVDVAAGVETVLPDERLCFSEDAARIAVVTGRGDRIEQLIEGLGLRVETLLDGTPDGWASSAKPFLLDGARLLEHDVLFVDCAAALRSGSVDLGTAGEAETIASNLRQFVAKGGSVYASDWAFLFPALAWPGQIRVLDPDGAPRSPFPTSELQGFAPQTIRARVSDSGLASYLGKSTVDIAFPMQSGAQSLHWGLLEDSPPAGAALIEGTVRTCADERCQRAGGSAVNIPLAVLFSPLPNGASGRVIYTSFHNIAQPTDDVQAILRYLVFHL